MHDIIYDMLHSMSDEAIFTDDEYNKGFVDGLGEAYKIILEKLQLFGIENFPPDIALPSAEDWLRNGPKAIVS